MGTVVVVIVWYM